MLSGPDHLFLKVGIYDCQLWRNSLEDFAGSFNRINQLRAGGLAQGFLLLTGGPNR